MTYIYCFYLFPIVYREDIYGVRSVFIQMVKIYDFNDTGTFGSRDDFFFFSNFLQRKKKKKKMVNETRTLFTY